MKRYQKILASAVTAAALVLGMSGTAFAYTGPATVATDDLNLREKGGLDANVIDCLPRGAKVTVNFDAGYGWYQVSYNGKIGYIAGYYLLLGDTGPAETPAPAAPAPENAAVEVGAAEEAPADEQGAPQTPADETPAAEQTPVTETPEATPAPVAAPAPVSVGSSQGTIRGSEVRLRSGPSMTSETIAYLYDDYKVNVHGACGKWYEVEYNNSVGYVYGDYVILGGQNVTYSLSVATIIDNTAIYTEPVTDETYVDPEPVPVEVITDPVSVIVEPTDPEPQPSPAAPTQSSVSHNAAAGQAIVDTAMEMLGVPYVWGGESLAEGGFDCSGLVYYAYGKHGIKLNRVAQAMYYNGTAVDLNDLQAGDILLFGSSIYNIWHAALYVGNGMFIHAPYSGTVVRTQYLSETYGMKLVAARRLV